MHRVACTLTVFAVLASMPTPAAAVGEIFKVETTGTEYCGDLVNDKFNAKNNVDLWVRVASETEWDISFSPLFPADQTVPLLVRSFLVAPKKLSFSAAQFFPHAFVSMQGFITLDPLGAMKRGQGTFIQDSITRPGCFSSGKFTTTQRLQ